jgi:hypothetical protein
MLGDQVSAAGANVAVKGTIPVATQFVGVTQELFGDGAGKWLANTQLNQVFAWNIGNTNDQMHIGQLAMGGSGTSKSSPIGQNQGTPNNFVSGAYIQINNGTVLSAGSNTYSYFFNSPPSNLDTFLIIPISGLPATAMSFSGSISAGTFTLVAIAQAGVTLGAALVLRVINIGSSTLVL